MPRLLPTQGGRSRRLRGRQRRRFAARSSNAEYLDDTTAFAYALDVDHHLDGDPNRLTNARVWQPDIRHQDAVRQPGQSLLGGIRVNRAEAPQMTGIERLQQV